MDQSSNHTRRRIVLRLLRIALIAFVLFLLAIVMNPKRYLPEDMTLGEFFQALLGALMLSLVFAAGAFRAWNDYQRKKREKNESR